MQDQLGGGGDHSGERSSPSPFLQEPGTHKSTEIQSPFLNLQIGGQDQNPNPSLRKASGMDSGMSLQPLPEYGVKGAQRFNGIIGGIFKKDDNQFNEVLQDLQEKRAKRQEQKGRGQDQIGNNPLE